MQPVIEHILARKGNRPPYSDGRTTTLILYGGSMSGVVGAGAMIALEEMGLNHAFDNIICHSAGLPNASYLLADDTHRGTSIYLEECTTRSFINFLRIWKVVDIDYLVDVMRNTKPLGVHTLLKSGTQIHVEMYNADTRREEYLEAHQLSVDEYFELLHGATAIHFLHPGTSTIRGKRYMDIRSNKKVHHLDQAAKLKSTDILIIYNRLDQPDPVRELRDHIVEILPDEQYLVGGYERNPDILRTAARQMGRKVKKMFGIDEPVRL